MKQSSLPWATSQASIILAKLPIVFLQNGYHGNKIVKPHSILCRVTSHVVVLILCASSLSPEVMAMISVPVPKKLLQ